MHLSEQFTCFGVLNYGLNIIEADIKMLKRA